MIIIGCDFHPSLQPIAGCDSGTGEYGTRRLEHGGEAEAFYRSLQGRAVRAGMEATGSARWFEPAAAGRPSAVMVGIGDPAKVTLTLPTLSQMGYDLSSAAAD